MPINMALIKQPMNWLIILAMLFVSSIAITLLADAVRPNSGE